MKFKFPYLFFIFAFFATVSAQTRQFNLAKGNTQFFHGSIYCYGFLTQTSKPTFCVYKLTTQLQTVDSIFVDLGNAKSENYLQITSDTLHEYLNIYLQKKEKKLVNVLRFTSSLELLNINNVDVARLNSISNFEPELLYAGKCVYTVKSQKDSLGQQFYLNKFNLKSELKNFDYEFAWQFSFERQFINSAHVFYANRQVVFLYVTVNGGPKQGQWILSINAASGKLIRGTKLNDKGELNSYEFGNFIRDSLARSLTLVGQKFSEAQLKPQENKLAISNAPYVSLYLIEVDSTGDITSKQDFKIPITDLKPNSKKVSSNYIFKVGRFTKTRDGKFSMETDAFKNTDNSLTYRYITTCQINLQFIDETLTMEKNSIATNALIEKFYTGLDKTDRNGKIAVDSLNAFEKLFYTSENFAVKQQFKLDAENNPVWILKKSDPKKNRIAYSFVTPVKKIYQLTPIEETSTFNNPLFISTGISSFVISRQLDENVFQLKTYAW